MLKYWLTKLVNQHHREVFGGNKVELWLYKKNLHKLTRKKAMLKALEKSLGVVSHACKAVGISRQTHYDWIEDDEKYKKAVLDIEDKAIDFAETKLHELIAGVKLPETKVFAVDDGVGGKKILTYKMTKHYAPDTIATIFYLKTKGKKRGYIETQEFTIPSDKLLKIEIVQPKDD